MAGAAEEDKSAATVVVVDKDISLCSVPLLPSKGDDHRRRAPQVPPCASLQGWRRVRHALPYPPLALGPTGFSANAHADADPQEELEGALRTPASL
jgi:hypothetical protein